MKFWVGCARKMSCGCDVIIKKIWDADGWRCLGGDKKKSLCRNQGLRRSLLIQFAKRCGLSR